MNNNPTQHWFDEVSPETRCKEIENLIGRCLSGNEKDGYDIILSVQKASHNAPETHLPAYHISMAYVCVYVLNDTSFACMFADSCLALLSCFHRDHLLLPAYKWIAKEEHLNRYIFNLKGEVYKYPVYVSIDTLVESLISKRTSV